MQHTKSTTSEVDTALIKSMIMFLDSNNNNHQPLFVVLILFLYTCFSMSNCMYVCTCVCSFHVPRVCVLLLMYTCNNVYLPCVFVMYYKLHWCLLPILLVSLCNVLLLRILQALLSQGYSRYM